MAVLAQARAMRYEIGTNLKGTGGSPAWTLLLPRLGLRTVIVIGSLPSAERSALSDLAERVIGVEQAEDVAELERRLGPADDRTIDLVRVGSGGAALLERIPSLGILVAERLSERASTFTEWRGRRAPSSPGPLDVDKGAADDLLLAPATGPARLIAPTRHAGATAGLPGARRAATPAARPGRWRVRLDRLASRTLGSRPLRRWTDRRARLVTRAAGHGPPAWVAGIAASADVDIEGCGWVLLAPGDYATQKVLLVLLDPVDERPRMLVKISPDPAHAERLRTETSALTRLATLDIAAGRVPIVAFAGEHDGRAIVAERWISGRPFDAVTSATADSSHYADATRWLTSLAAATVRHRDAGEVGAALRDLFERFRAARLPLSEDELDALDSDVRTVESHRGTVPVVFQHGDPGAWNLVVDESERVVFLDWESAEFDGIPLWDLFYLQRSFAALAAHRAGARGGDAGLRHLVTPSSLQRRFTTEIGNQARVVGLAEELVAPLFFTCWMHRALKEVTRRRGGTLARGPHLRFLRTMLARRTEPELRRLLVTGGGRD